MNQEGPKNHKQFCKFCHGGTNVASPADKDGVIQLTIMEAGNICQLYFQGTVDYRSLSAGDATLDVLCGWKIELSLQVREITANNVECSDLDLET